MNREQEKYYNYLKRCHQTKPKIIKVNSKDYILAKELENLGLVIVYSYYGTACMVKATIENQKNIYK